MQGWSLDLDIEDLHDTLTVEEWWPISSGIYTGYQNLKNIDLSNTRNGNRHQRRYAGISHENVTAALKSLLFFFKHFLHTLV